MNTWAYVIISSDVSGAILTLRFDLILNGEKYVTESFTANVDELTRAPDVQAYLTGRVVEIQQKYILLNRGQQFVRQFVGQQVPLPDSPAAKAPDPVM